MYHQGYGIIETLAPLHVGASAGEETGNLNLIFRDQFTQTGIIPGSSIRGRFRADMRSKRTEENSTIFDENYWYGHEAIEGQKDGGTTEAIIKFEYASLLWFPVFCPGQAVIWISCPRLLKRFKKIANISTAVPAPYTAANNIVGRQVNVNEKVLFFNLGFVEIEKEEDFSDWIPTGLDFTESNLLVVADNDIAILHDMGLYRQSRIKMLDDEKKVDTEKGAFFNVEALPEGSILVFPIAAKETGWQPFGKGKNYQDLYFGGLESVGFGRCQVRIEGDL